jgi:ketosteroid isomerase-like protein
MFREKNFVYKAYRFWIRGDSKNFFRVINGNLEFSPAPWDKNIWIEYLNEWYNREDLINILTSGSR